MTSLRNFLEPVVLLACKSNHKYNTAMLYVNKIMAIIITNKIKVNSFYLVCKIGEVFLLYLYIYKRQDITEEVFHSHSIAKKIPDVHFFL